MKLEGDTVLGKMGSIETEFPNKEGTNVSERKSTKFSLARYVNNLRCQG